MKQKIFFLFSLVVFFALSANYVSADLGHTGAQFPHSHDTGVDDGASTNGGATVTAGSGGCPAGTAPAAASGICLPVGTDLDLSEDSILITLGKALLFLASVIASVATVMIVIAGIMYIVSSGDTARIERAKSTLLFAIIGLIIALLAWVIVVTILSVFADPADTGCPPDAIICWTF